MKILEHYLNELSIYCRLKDAGMGSCSAKIVSKIIGNLLFPIAYPFRFFCLYGYAVLVVVWLLCFALASCSYKVSFGVPDASDIGNPFGPARFEEAPLIEKWRLK